MSNCRILGDYLSAHAGARYCDDCASTLAGVTSQHQANQLVHRLEGALVRLMPQLRYAKASASKLHQYGTGPFCRFRIRPRPEAGVYVLIVDDEVLYLGECANLSLRFNAGYGQISPRNCYEAGQSQNCRINTLILDAVTRGQSVSIWFCACAGRKKIERELIERIRPRWNN